MYCESTLHLCESLRVSKNHYFQISTTDQLALLSKLWLKKDIRLNNFEFANIRKKLGDFFGPKNPKMEKLILIPASNCFIKLIEK